MGFDSNDGRFEGKNVSVKDLLQEAYAIKKSLISGVPGTVASARFDVLAKVLSPGDDEGKQRRAKMLALLVDRFHLKAHVETKTLSVYELVVMKGGPKFKAAVGTSGGTHITNRELTATAVPMQDLASILTDQVQKTVIDKTGLTGLYDYALKWSKDDFVDAGGANAPSIYTALQEQLGLKLQAGKGPVETLVIDHMEMPTEN